MSTLENILSRAREGSATIVLSEGTDPRIVDAGVRAARDGIARIILVGSDVKAEGVEVLDPATSSHREALVASLVEARAHKGMTEARATVEVLDPLVFSALMVRAGLADGTVGGAINTTADVVRHAIQLIGRAPGAKLVSSFFLMEMEAPHHDPKGTVVFADCGLVVDPSAEELAGIGIDSAASFAAFVGGDPKVGFISFSTLGSAHHPDVSKVQEAVEIARKTRPDLDLDGEFQFDAAFVPSVAARKAPDSAVAGRANVFVFPDLNTGNTAYKIAQRIGGATAIGPILQGLAKPANDLSRGCSAEDAYHLIAATAVQAAG